MRRLRLVLSVAVSLAGLGGAAAWASSVTVTSTHLGAASPAVPPLFPSSVDTANGSGVSGYADKDDTVAIDYVGGLDPTTVCSGWSRSGSPQTAKATVTIADNTGQSTEDVLTVAAGAGAPCTTLHIGTVSLGSGQYVTGGAVTFPGSTVTYTLASGVPSLTVTLGKPAIGGGNRAQVRTGSACRYSPDAAVADTSGHTAGSNSAVGTATVQF